jgi:hypothetical protein
MIVIKDTIVSEELIENFFVCDLDRCRGACCVEGDLGAPLEAGELETVRNSLDTLRPYLSDDGIREVTRQGPYVKDFEGDFTTPTINGKECAYSVYDSKGILKCGFEKAWADGKSGFRKPVSCHLYPVRIKENKAGAVVNYHRWNICDPACKLGLAMQLPLYVFVKEALIRKFGADWYAELDRVAHAMKPDQNSDRPGDESRN